MYAPTKHGKVDNIKTNNFKTLMGKKHNICYIMSYEVRII